MTGLFDRCTTVGVQLESLLVASICQPQLFYLRRQLRAFEQAKVVLSPFAKGSTDDSSCQIVHDNLHFQRVLSRFAAVEPFLVFFYCGKVDWTNFASI
jgi:hypothetical protein